MENRALDNLIMDEQLHTTSDPQTIMSWVKERGGTPALESKDEETDLRPELKINFAVDEMNDKSQEITWEQFFEELEARKLAFRYKELNNDGRSSSHFEFVNRS
jgi:hypothetical protein